MDVPLCPQGTHLIPFHINLYLHACSLWCQISGTDYEENRNRKEEELSGSWGNGILGNFHFLLNFSAFFRFPKEGMYYFCNQKA